jgi:hypothetical protein
MRGSAEEDDMSVLLFPLRVVGWAALGCAAAVGWHVGKYMVNAALEDSPAADVEGSDALVRKESSIVKIKITEDD